MCPCFDIISWVSGTQRWSATMTDKWWTGLVGNATMGSSEQISWPQITNHIHNVVGLYILVAGCQIVKLQITILKYQRDYPQFIVMFGFVFLLGRKKWIYWVCSILGVSGSLSNMTLLTIHMRIRDKLMDPTGKKWCQWIRLKCLQWSGVLLCNFLLMNLGMSILQFPFSASSSFAGSWVFWSRLK